MRPRDVAQLLFDLLPEKVPVMLWGAPGVGKSDLMRQVTARLQAEMIDLRCVCMDGPDAKGLPMVREGVTCWARPYFLREDGVGVLFLDELPQATMQVQPAFLELLLDRRSGEHKIGDGWMIAAAGNRTEDRAGANRLITPMNNRLIHIDVEVSNDDWLEWASLNSIDEVVRSYIKWQPNALHEFNPDTNERAFPTPRSWAMVSRVCKRVHNGLLQEAVIGTVGKKRGTEFAGFCEIYRSLPDLDEWLASPLTVKMPKEANIQYAISGAMVFKCKGAAQPTLKAAVQILSKMNNEIGTLTFADLVRPNPALFMMPEAKAFAAKMSDLLNR